MFGQKRAEWMHQLKTRPQWRLRVDGAAGRRRRRRLRRCGASKRRWVGRRRWWWPGCSTCRRRWPPCPTRRSRARTPTAATPFWPRGAARPPCCAGPGCSAGWSRRRAPCEPATTDPPIKIYWLEPDSPRVSLIPTSLTEFHPVYLISPSVAKFDWTIIVNELATDPLGVTGFHLVTSFYQVSTGNVTY